MLNNARIGNYIAPPVAPAAAPVIPINPVLTSVALHIGRQLALGVFAVHSFVGHGAAPNRDAIALRPAVTQVRAVSPRVRSFVGRQQIAPAPAVARIIVDPTVRTIRISLPKLRSVVCQSAGEIEGRGPFPRIVSSQVRIQPPPTRSIASKAGRLYLASHERWSKPIVASIKLRPVAGDSFIASAKPPAAAAATPAPSRARPIAALVRALRPSTRSTVAAPQPHIPPAATSRARLTIVSVRTPLPRISSFEGPQGKWFRASHERWTKPILAFIRSLRPAVRTTIGAPRPHAIPAAAPRPRPRVALVRLPIPRTRASAGFGKPSSYNTKLAIALDARSAPLSADASTTASIGARQNVATIALETQDGTAVALGAVNSATISLNTSE
jgi:hypothetical protein